MKQALVIGFGLSGRSAAQLLLSKGFKVIAMDAKKRELMAREDAKELIQKGVILIEEGPIPPHDFAVCSPGIPFTHPIVQQCQEVVSEVALAFKYITQPVLGISGTNGKTTVTLLVEHTLKAAGKKARALGNVGLPLSSAIEVLAPDEIVVAELSSYQLEGLNRPILDSSVLLNITPDHLERYGTMENYTAAKLKLKEITKGDFFIFEPYQHLCPSSASYGYKPTSPIWTDLKNLYFNGHKVLLPEELSVKSHDLENFMAAFALCLTHGVPPEEIIKAYATFIKPHHRIEFVRDINGVKFFDDSKGTNIDAVVRAVEKMEGPTHLIVGGVDKGASYAPWIPHFQGKVKGIYAIGQAAKKMQQDLYPLQVEIYTNLQAAFEVAYRHALPGECVLLSPGCSSFDMFIDYADRGRAFQKLVLTIVPVK